MEQRQSVMTAQVPKGQINPNSIYRTKAVNSSLFTFFDARTFRVFEICSNLIQNGLSQLWRPRLALAAASIIGGLIQNWWPALAASSLTLTESNKLDTHGHFRSPRLLRVLRERHRPRIAASSKNSGLVKHWWPHPEMAALALVQHSLAASSLPLRR